MPEIKYFASPAEVENAAQEMTFEIARLSKKRDLLRGVAKKMLEERKHILSQQELANLSVYEAVKEGLVFGERLERMRKK